MGMAEPDTANIMCIRFRRSDSGGRELHEIIARIIHGGGMNNAMCARVRVGSHQLKLVLSNARSNEQHSKFIFGRRRRRR